MDEELDLIKKGDAQVMDFIRSEIMANLEKAIAVINRSSLDALNKKDFAFRIKIAKDYLDFHFTYLQIIYYEK